MKGVELYFLSTVTTGFRRLITDFSQKKPGFSVDWEIAEEGEEACVALLSLLVVWKSVLVVGISCRD